MKRLEITLPITPITLIENTNHNLVDSGKGAFITNAEIEVDAISIESPIFRHNTDVGL